MTGEQEWHASPTEYGLWRLRNRATGHDVYEGAEATVKLIAARFNEVLPDWGHRKVSLPAEGAELTAELKAAWAAVKAEAEAARPVVTVTAFEITIVLEVARTVFAADEKTATAYANRLELDELFDDLRHVDCRRDVRRRALGPAARDGVSRRPKDGPPEFGDVVFTDGRFAFGDGRQMPARFALEPRDSDHEDNCPAYSGVWMPGRKAQDLGPCTCILRLFAEEFK